MSKIKINFVSIPRSASQSIHAALETDKYMNHKSISLFPENGLPAFAIIREPVDHAMSWYAHHKSRKKLAHLYEETLEQWCINGFNTHWSPEECNTMGINHALNQFDYISEGGSVVVEHLLRYEHLENDFFNLCAEYDIQPRELRTTSVSANLEIPDCMEELLKKSFPKNFELYGEIND